MFRILHKTFRTGVVTTTYPKAPSLIAHAFRGAPVFDFGRWQDARPAAEVCPTEAISFVDVGESRNVKVDYGRCVFCGLCAEQGAGEAVRTTQEFELASRDRKSTRLNSSHIQKSRMPSSA